MRAWDLHSKALLSELVGHRGFVWSLGVTADGRWAVTGSSSDPTVRVWEVASGACVAALEGHADEVQEVAVSSDGRRVLSVSRDGTMRVWDRLDPR